MENFKIFAKHLKILRESHDLSMSELAELLFMKSSAAINEFEAGRSKPTLETAITISTYFGVSLEWLLGLSKIPYTEASIASANIAKAERTLSVDVNDEIGNMITILMKELGVQPKTQIANTSLALQGNYIFLMNATFLNDMEHLRKSTDETPIARFGQWLNDFFAISKPKRLDKRKAERYKKVLDFHAGLYENPIFVIPKEENL